MTQSAYRMIHRLHQVLDEQVFTEIVEESWDLSDMTESAVLSHTPSQAPFLKLTIMVQFDRSKYEDWKNGSFSSLNHLSSQTSRTSKESVLNRTHPWVHPDRTSKKSSNTNTAMIPTTTTTTTTTTAKKTKIYTIANPKKYMVCHRHTCLGLKETLYARICVLSRAKRTRKIKSNP